MKKIIKQLFCKHYLAPIQNNYALLGYYQCKKCGKQKYIGDNVEFKHFKLGTFKINSND